MDFYNSLKKLPEFYQLRRFRYLREFHHAHWANLFEGVYPDFATALKHVPLTKRMGYDHSEPANMYKERAARVYPTDSPAYLGLVRLWFQP